MATSYLLNSNIHGYERVTIDNFKFDDKRDDTVVTIIDKGCDDKLPVYYNMFNNLLKQNNKVVLVGVNDENKSFRVLASLLVTYNDYNIYQIEDKNTLGAKELQVMCERTPDLTEVQTFIGGDVTAYSDMSTIVFGIESLVNEGNEDQLKDFLNQHMISIGSLTYTLNYMKHICDTFNSDELLNKIDRLKEKITSLEKQVEDSKKTIDDIKYEKEKIQVELEGSKREVNKLKATNTELRATSESGGSIVKQYNTINTQLISCKTKIVMYFKEISYVQYTNSLIINLLKYLENSKLKAKLIIYDSQGELYSVYKPLNIVSGEDYLSMKGTLTGKTKMFVVSEPITNVLQDVLIAEQCFDVVIVYDRLKGIKDLVQGNNVTKLFVIGSNNEYEALKGQLKISDPSSIITTIHSTMAMENKTKQTLDIPYVNGYSHGTDTKRQAIYIRLQPSGYKETLMNILLKKARVDTLTSK